MSRGRYINNVKRRPKCPACGGPLRKRQGILWCDRCQRRDEV